MKQTRYKPPFFWFGGKSAIAKTVWDILGDVNIYCEPFFGAGHVLFNRPDYHENRIEVVNDYNGFVANFWRAVKYAPKQVAKYAYQIQTDYDYHAIANWLMQNAHEYLINLKTNPFYYNPMIAGWWAWSVCCSIGCEFINVTPYQLNKRVIRSSIKISYDGVCRLSIKTFEDLLAYLESLSKRLYRVKVYCKDWLDAVRVVTSPAVLTYRNNIGVFLDPPYEKDIEKDGLYGVKYENISSIVLDWCKTYSDDHRLKIIVCGHEGEYNTLEQLGWLKIRWARNGGFGNVNKTNTTKYLERFWLSPSCYKNGLLEHVLVNNMDLNQLQEVLSHE